MSGASTREQECPTVNARKAVGQEFLGQQLPLIACAIVLGYAAGYLQHGFFPRGEQAFPLTGMHVPVWHVIWMGAWTGYTMGVVGEAAGIFALPYTMSVLQFSNPHVTPTTQLLTFLNPLGALLGYRRSGQWNLDLALWVCLGGIVGGLIGPFFRLTVLSDVKPFQFTVGVVLAFAGVHLLTGALRGFRDHRRRWERGEGRWEERKAEAGFVPAQVEVALSHVISTISKDRGQVTIGYQDRRWTLDPKVLFITGALVGTLASALGVGGGFLLVPIFASIYRLPMYVLVAATIPYVIVLSCVGLCTYGIILPAITGTAIHPEWAWGLFASAGGIFGSWAAAKTQRFVPEHYLKLMLGAVTGIAGSLYVINMFFPLPFRL